MQFTNGAQCFSDSCYFPWSTPGFTTWRPESLLRHLDCLHHPERVLIDFMAVSGTISSWSVKINAKEFHDVIDICFSSCTWCVSLQRWRFCTRYNSTLAAPSPDESPKEYSEKITNIVDEISKLTLIEVADLNELLKVNHFSNHFLIEFLGMFVINFDSY